MLEAIRETGKNLQAFANLLLVLIFLREFLAQLDTIVLIYGLLTFLIIYTIGFYLIKGGSDV